MPVRARFRRSPKLGNGAYTAVSAHLSNTAAKRRDVAEQFLDQLRQVAEINFADIIAGDFDTTAYRERGKAKMSSIGEVWEETPADSSARRGSNVGPDGGLRRRLRLHNDKELQTELACCKAWKLSS